MAGTLLEGVTNTLVVIETTLIVGVGKCVLDSKRYVSISGTLLTGRVTADGKLEISTVSPYTYDCDDGVSVTSEMVTSAVSPYTSDDCDDGVSSEYVDTVEQFMNVTV